MIRPTQDNVVCILEPEQEEFAHGIKILAGQGPTARASRTALVLAVGPGYWRTTRRLLGDRVVSEPTEVFVPCELKPGDRIVVDANPGNDYRLDLQIPRHNVGHEFAELLGVQAKFRLIREMEAYAVIETVAEVEQAAE